MAYLPDGAPCCQLLNDTRMMYGLRCDPVRSSAPALVMIVGVLEPSSRSRTASALALLTNPISTLTLSCSTSLRALFSASCGAAPSSSLMTVAFSPPIMPLCLSRKTSMELAMSGPNAAYGPENPESRPIFSVPPLVFAAGAALLAAAGWDCAAPFDGAVAPLHAASSGTMVTAPAPATTARNTLRRDNCLSMTATPYSFSGLLMGCYEWCK